MELHQIVKTVFLLAGSYRQWLQPALSDPTIDIGTAETTVGFVLRKDILAVTQLVNDHLCHYPCQVIDEGVIGDTLVSEK